MSGNKVQHTDWGTLTWLWEPSDLRRDRLSAALVKFNPGSHQPPHSHSSEEQYMYVISGAGVSVFNGERTQLSTGTAIHLPAFGVHEVIASQEGLELLIVYAPAPVDTFNVFQGRAQNNLKTLREVLGCNSLVQQLQHMASSLEIGIFLVDSKGVVQTMPVNLPAECCSCLALRGNRAPFGRAAEELQVPECCPIECCPNSYFVLSPLSDLIVVGGPIRLKGPNAVPRSRIYAAQEAIRTLGRLIETLATQRELELLIKEQVASLTRYVPNSSSSMSEPSFTPNTGVSKVLSVIHSQAYPSLDLNQAAALAGLSPSHFSRVFSRQMGMPFVKYCNVVKVSRAKTLLASTDLTIKEIAYQVGFESAAYFGRVFRQLEGQTPSAFRKSLRLKKVIN